MTRAGFHTADITPALGMEVPADYVKLRSERVHDPLKVRAAVFEQDDQTLAFVGLDTLAFLMPETFVEPVRKAIAARCGIPADHVLIAASHTHSGGPLFGFPDHLFADAPALVRELATEHTPALDPLYCAWATQQTITAVCEAYRKREEVMLSVGSGIEDQVLFNRRFHMRNGRTYTHPGKGNPEIVEPAGPVDPEVGVVGAWNSRGELIGCLVNYGCHCTTFSGGTSADYVYYLEQVVQGAFGRDAVVVFLQGASGDVTQVDNRSMRPPEHGELWSRRVGMRVGAEVVKTLAAAVPGDLTPFHAAVRLLPVRRRAPSPVRVAESRRIVEHGPRAGVRDAAWIFAKEILLLDHIVTRSSIVNVEVQALQLGPALFVCNPAEYFAESGLSIKRASPFPFTFVVTLANGDVGYVPPATAFEPDGGGYETVLTSVSNLEIGAAERIAQASIALARQQRPGQVPDLPGLDSPRPPWDYGVLGPDRD